MTHFKIYALIVCVTLLIGCSTPQPSGSSLVHYQPKDGDQSRLRFEYLSDVDKGAMPRFRPSPDFNFAPKYLGSIVRVVVEITVNSTGEVTDSRLISADPTFVGEPVAASYLRAKFEPARKNGETIECKLRMTLSFTLSAEP